MSRPIGSNAQAANVMSATQSSPEMILSPACVSPRPALPNTVGFSSVRPCLLEYQLGSLSATSLALRRFRDERDVDRIPLGFCVAADGLRIDIAPWRGDRL